MNPGAVIIRVDYREMASGVPDLLRGLASVTIEVEQLGMADYVIGPRVAVERKSAADFLASIVDRRLFAQLEQLVGAYERVIYLVEGPSLYEAGRLHPNAIRGALSYLAVLSGVSVLRSENAQDSALLLATMARHAQQGLGYEISNHPTRSATAPHLRARYLLEDVPGIGPKTATALLRHFGTLQALFAATEADLVRVPGMGPKRARQMHELLTAPFPGAPDGEANHTG